MKQLVFGIVLAAALVNCLTIGFSIVRPDRRIWPPSDRDSWRYTYDGIVSFTSLLGVVVLGIVDWNSFALPNTVRFVAGGLLLVACGLFALWGYLTLGAHASRGLVGDLVTTGPYRYSRNPQYVGTIAALVGWVVVSGSVLALVAALFVSAWFVLAPFAEEPWCRERLGPAYDEYAATVPRFLGRRRPPY